MFVHLGKNSVVRSSQIVAIIDYQVMEGSEVNQAYVDRAGRERKIQDVSKGRPHSLVITNEYIYLSAISSTTLKKRTENPHYLA